MSQLGKYIFIFLHIFSRDHTRGLVLQKLMGRDEPADYQEWDSRQRQGQEAGAARASTEGRGNPEAGKKKTIKAAHWSTEVRRETNWELQELRDVENGSLRKSLNMETEKAPEALACLHDRFEQSNRDFGRDRHEV